MKFQMDEKKKIRKSDFVIVNNKSEEDLVKQAGLISNVLKAIK